MWEWERERESVDVLQRGSGCELTVGKDGSAAIAVSGGPDSMALCLLAKQWWQGFRESGIYAEKLTGIVVDHGLRPGSATEALQVQRWVSNLGQFAARQSWPCCYHTFIFGCAEPHQ